MSNNELLLGIDPGWKNLGYALLEPEGLAFRIVSIGHTNPSTSGVLYPSVFAAWLHNEVTPASRRLRHVTIERYVAYENKMSSETENILLTIGGLQHAMLDWVRPSGGVLGMGEIHMYRAIDWKVRLAQVLHLKTGFNNPSTKLDKVFSIAAAKALVTNPELIQNDHQADAVCLAAFPVVTSSAVT